MGQGRSGGPHLKTLIRRVLPIEEDASSPTGHNMVQQHGGMHCCGPVSCYTCIHVMVEEWKIRE